MKLVIFLLTLGALQAEEETSRRIQAHLFLKDYQTAYQEAKAAFAENLEPRVCLENYILTSLKAGHEARGVALFEEYERRYGIENSDFLEEVAFGLIQSGSGHSNPMVRGMAMIAAFHANDARGVTLLKKGLSDKSALVRAVSIKLSASLRDKMLQQEIQNIIAKERLYDLKLDAIRAVGTMKIQEARESLINIITSTRSGDEARSAALEAFVNLDNKLRPVDLHRMAESERSGFRELSDVVIAHLDLQEEIGIPIKHLSDANQDVRRGAIIALGRMAGGENFPKDVVIKTLRPLLSAREENTRIAALWLMTILSPGEAEEGWHACLCSPYLEMRIKAAAALKSTGFSGMSLMQKSYHLSTCPYVRLNLALGMIPLGIDESGALHTVKEALVSPERWSMREDALSEAILPGRLATEQTTITPEAVNQLVRLQLLNLLAIKGDPDTMEMLRAFLKERRWGITGVASALLLSEGDEEAKRSVEKLLDDPDKKVRFQAAFVLATWKMGGKALDILQEAYEGVDRDLKVKVLEALGHLGDKKLLPFLASKLSEPFPTLRLAASLAIIQTIYH